MKSWTRIVSMSLASFAGYAASPDRPAAASTAIAFPSARDESTMGGDDLSRWRVAARRWRYEQAQAGRWRAAPTDGLFVTPAWTNIRVSPACDAYSSELSLAINPVNPLSLIAGANDFGCGSPTGINGAYRSTDGGNTWSVAASMYNGLGGTGFAGPWGDPSLEFDDAGHALYSDIYDNGCGATACAVSAYQSTDGGGTWPLGVMLNVATNDDKNWTTVDNIAASPFHGRAYTSWDYFTGGERNVTSFSTDAGATWSGINTVRNGTYFVTNTTDYDTANSLGYFLVAGDLGGRNGNVSVSRSTNGGLTYTSVTAFTRQGTTGGVPPQDFLTPGFDADRGFGTSPFAGRLYLAVVDRRAGQTRKHVWVERSTDFGATWSAPVQVDDAVDTHDHSYVWLATSPTNGGVFAFYYDFGCAAGAMANPYRYSMSSSTDGGLTWHQMAVQDSSVAWGTTRSGNNWVGDYESGKATDAVIYPYWADARDGSTVVKSYTQPVPNPMPWVSAVGPVVTRGVLTTVTITGDGFIPTITPYAIVFDDANMTGTITSVSATTITVDVTTTMAVPGGAREWSLKYGIPVASITVAAAVKSGCQNAVQVNAGTATVTATRTVSPTSTISATSTATPSETATMTPTETATPAYAGIYPNPASVASGVGVSFSGLPEGTSVSIYNVAGELIRTATADDRGIAAWNLLNDAGMGVTKGLYVYRYVAPEGTKQGIVTVIP